MFQLNGNFSNANAILILTEWDEFKQIDFTKLLR